MQGVKSERDLIELLNKQRWPRWLNLKEAAAYSGCSVNTFKRHVVASGRVKPRATDYGTRYDREEIDAAISNFY